jgi:hypothetical protein
MRFDFTPHLFFAPTPNTGGTPGIPSNDDIANVEKLTKLYLKNLTITEAQAKSKAEEAKAQGTLNQELQIYQDRLESISFQSDYIFRSFQETTAELKNQNLLLNLGKSAFKKISDIASDVNYYQKGSNDLTDKQFKKMQESLNMRKDDLKFTVKNLENSEGEFKSQDKILRLERLLETATGKRKKQAEAMLGLLNKERDTYLASKNALEQTLPLLQKELDFSKNIAQTREDLGGLATAAAGTLSKYGGSLSSFLNIDSAKESVEEYNKKLIDDALKRDDVLKELRENELKRIKLEAELEGLTGDKRKEKLDEINDLEKDNLRIKQEAINSVNKFENKLGSLKVLTKDLAVGFKKALTDPLTIASYLIDNLLKGSTGIAAFEKSLGVSYEQAYKLNTQLNFVGNNVFDAYINGEKLKKSFIDLSESMGFVADYGNEALVSMTNLTGKLGLSNQEAAQLTTLSRMQSTNTEAVLDNVGRSVTAMNKQGKTTILLKDVMKEVANVSKATAVSLGSNPVKIAEAVVAAKQLGTTLQQMESTADSLLNFESSIENELKAELLTGKQMNLERARAAALANDMKGLSEEIGKNEEIIGAFASNNRLAQQATAEALGMSREELANMVYKQEAITIGAEGVRAKYGEQAYEALKAQDAQEKFANSVEKLKSAFSSIVQIFSPLIDGIAFVAEVISSIISQWFILYPLVGIVALSYLPKMLAGFTNIGKSIADVGKNFTSMFSKEGRASLFGGADKTKETITSSRGLTLTKKTTEGGTEAAEKTAGAADKTKGDNAAGFKDKMKNIAEGIKAFGNKDVLFGAINLIPSSIGLIAMIPGLLGAKLIEQINGEKFQEAMYGIAYGIEVMGTGKVLKGALGLVLASVGLLLLTPAIPALLLLQLVKGDLIEQALTGLGKGLAALGEALSKGQIILGIAVLTGAMIGLGFALNLAAPGIEAFGKAIKSAFEGIGTIITAAANGIATIFGSLQNVDVIKLLAIGPALIGIGLGLASLGAGGVISAIGAFLGGDPIEKLQDLAASGDGLTQTATALQAIAGALIGISVALASIDISKLEALDEFASNRSTESIVGGITDFITAPIKAIGESIGGGDKEGINAGIDLTPMIAAINEVKTAINSLQNRPVKLYVDSKEIMNRGVQGSYQSA